MNTAAISTNPRSIFNPKGMKDLVGILTQSKVKAAYEHTAMCAHLNLEEDKKAFFINLGFEVMLEVPDVAVFIGRPGLRIELIKQGVPEHEAWIVETKVEWKTLRKSFEDSEDFTALEDQVHMYPHLQAAMFEHKDGGFVQIIWRKKPIYPGLFD